jgi:hypothetical protein
MKVPEVNKKYYYYDDGKISLDRQGEVIITEIVEFNKIDSEILGYWKREVKCCHWLYASKTDYFVKGKYTNTDEELIFVRTKNNGWFSLGFWAGRLDIDGSMTEKLNKDMK